MITVQIKPEHLKGNSFAHGEDGVRMCPLYEAIRAMGKEQISVGVNYASWVEDDKRLQHEINMNEWSYSLARGYIAKANDGDDTIVEVHLKPVDGMKFDEERI